MAKEVREVLASVRPVLAGGGTFIVGNSLLGIILPLCMEAAGYPVAVIGAIMAAYYAGLALGGLCSKRGILGFGHIRAFAAFAAVASTIALAYALVFSPPAWLLLRFVNGFCIAGLTATIESWLNAQSSNTTRGRVLGLYMVTHYLAVTAGQALVNLTDIAGPDLFMLAAALLSLSLVPVALTRLGGPSLDGHGSISIRRLHAGSPVGFLGAGVAGLMVGSFYALGVVFARGIGLGVAEATMFMMAVVLGGFCFQVPIGILADRFDRRLVLAAVLTTLGISWGAVVATGASELGLSGLLGLAFVFGGAISSIYPICVAECFDRLDRKHYVSASGRLLMVYSLGAMIGPVLAASVMTVLGPSSFFVFESTVAVTFAAIVTHSAWRRPPLPAEEQEVFVAVPDVTPVAAALDPRAEPDPEPFADDAPEVHDDRSADELIAHDCEAKPHPVRYRSDALAAE